MSKITVGTVETATGIPVEFPGGVSVAGSELGGSEGVSIVGNAADSRLLAAADGVLLVGNAVDKRDLAGSSGAGLVGWILSAIGGAVRTLTSKFQGYVDVYDFGVIGNGIADDTVAMQAALTHGALKNLVVRGLGAVIKISGPLTMTGPGLVFDLVGYGAANDPGIFVTGNGYTAMTISGRPQKIEFALYGTGNTANGVVLQNTILSKIDAIRVYKLDGFGVKVNKMWDSLIGTISVELCGNATEYAFSMNDDGDTCNMTHINRLQVEHANQRAIFISPNTLACVIDNIHSEQAKPAAGVNTWTLGGNRCLYNSLRLNSDTPSANATALFSGAQTQYNVPHVEGNIATVLEGFSGNAITIVSPDFAGITSVKVGNIGTVSIFGGNMARLSSDALILRVVGVKIGSCTINYAANNPNYAVFNGCSITLLASGSATSAATFNDCDILGGTLLQSNTRLINSRINLGSSYTISYRIAEFSNSEITCGMLTVDTAFMNLKNFSRIIGSLTMAGQKESLCDDSSYVSGVVTGWGAPTAPGYMPGGVFSSGMHVKNLAPAVGSSKGWVYAGAAWVSEGNL